MSPILPMGCRFFRQKDGKTLLIIEKGPQTRQLRWLGMNPDTTKISWRLAFPYTVFILEFRDMAITDNCRMYYRVVPLTSLKDELFHVNISNVYNTDKICTGDVRARGETIAEKAESFIASFWQSEFNTDLLDHFATDARNNPRLASLEAWQTASREDALFPLEIRWRKAVTIEYLLNGGYFQ